MENFEMKEALVEVRKAYRLLYGYQQRVLDLANFIGTHLGFKFISGNPWFSDGLPRRKSVSLKRWSWDWLPMYYYDFYFERDDLQLGVVIQSDTGFFDGVGSKKNDKLHLEQFAAPDKSDTRIILALSNGDWKSNAIWENFNFGINETEYPKGDKGISDGDIQIIAKAFSLVEFVNEQGARKCIEEFNEFCISKGINNLLSDEPAS